MLAVFCNPAVSTTVNCGSSTEDLGKYLFAGVKSNKKVIKQANIVSLLVMMNRKVDVDRQFIPTMVAKANIDNDNVN